jgi:hypothetical protein
MNWTVHSIFNAINLSVYPSIDVDISFTDILLATSALTLTIMGSLASLDNSSSAYGPRTFDAATSFFVRKKEVFRLNICEINFVEQRLERKDRPCLTQR